MVAAVAGESSSKQLVARMHEELLTARDPALVDEFFAEDFESHNMPPGFPPGRDGVRLFFGSFAEGLSDLEVDVDVVLAEDDLVAVRTTTRGTHTGPLLGIAATGRRLEIDGTDIVRVRDGRIVEHWGLTNTVGALEQVGGLARARWIAGLLRGRR